MKIPIFFIKKYFNLKEYKYNFVVLFITIWWVGLTSYFSFTTPYGHPPDEVYHIRLSQEYKRPSVFVIKDRPDLVSNNIISGNPNLYHFIQGKVLIFTNNYNDFRFLRLFNFFLGLIFFIACIKTINLYTNNIFTRIIFLFLITNTVMILYTFGAVSYDNPINLLAIFSFYYFYQLTKNNNHKSFINFLLISVVGSLIKFTYIPLFLIQLFYIFLSYFREKKILLLINTLKVNTLLTLLLVFLFSILISFYGLNLIRYKSLTPSCDQVLNYEMCQLDPATKISQEINLEEKIKPNFSNFYAYGFSWIRLMVERSFGIFSHNSILPNPEWISFLTLIIIFYSFIIVKQLNNKFDKHLIYISLTYVLILFIKNYSGFLLTGVNSVAVQGRYIFPIVFPLYYLFSKSIFGILRNKILVLVFFLLVIYAFFNYGPLYFIKNNLIIHFN